MCGNHYVITNFPEVVKQKEENVLLHDWLVYPKSKDVLYAICSFQKNWVKKSTLISQGLSYWQSAASKFQVPVKAENHKNSVQDFHMLISVSRNPNQFIENVMNKLDVSLIQKNRA